MQDGIGEALLEIGERRGCRHRLSGAVERLRQKEVGVIAEIACVQARGLQGGNGSVVLLVNKVCVTDNQPSHGAAAFAAMSTGIGFDRAERLQ